VLAAAARGPGRWQAVTFDALEFAAPARLGRVAWLDAGSWKGLTLFVLACLGFMVVGLRLLGASPYHSAMTLVYSATLVPLFFSLGSLSGKGPVEAQRDFLGRLSARLAKWRNLEQQQRGRFALGASAPDELRLGLGIADARAGLLGIEVGVGFANASLKRIALPVVIVRVRDGSPAHRALPRDAEWSRGRDPEERVAVVRPPLPLLPSISETVREVCQCLRDKPRSRAAKATAAKAPLGKPTSSKSSEATTAGTRASVSAVGKSMTRPGDTAPRPAPERRAFGAPKTGTASA
jgi:hypothetical protein